MTIVVFIESLIVVGQDEREGENHPQIASIYADLFCWVTSACAAGEKGNESGVGVGRDRVLRGIFVLR